MIPLSLPLRCCRSAGVPWCECSEGCRSAGICRQKSEGLNKAWDFSVGIFDATNNTKKRRNMLMKMAEGKCKIIFLETICNDERITERSMSQNSTKS
nr:uncharacterized protein LOC107419158 isoform X2 [Ziziphus jujuba var. spinosa]